MTQTIKVTQKDATQQIGVTTDVRFLKGDDGFSPVVELEEVEGGVNVSITDAQGTQTTFIASGTTVTDEQVQDAVDAYLAENPIEMFTTDETLTLENGVLSVNTAEDVEQDNTLPITSAAVHTTVGNIEVLLATI